MPSFPAETSVYPFRCKLIKEKIEHLLARIASTLAGHTFVERFLPQRVDLSFTQFFIERDSLPFS